MQHIVRPRRLTVDSSVRSTNVYEEKSLGVFPSEEELSPEDAFSHTGNRATVWGRYLAMHARKQLSFGKQYLSVYRQAALTVIVQICGGWERRCSWCASSRYVYRVSANNVLRDGDADSSAEEWFGGRGEQQLVHHLYRRCVTNQYMINEQH